jgi:hypothetical protein
MIYDLHTHTIYSHHWFFGVDALNTPEEMVRAAVKRGLNGMAITDHDNVKGALKAKAFAKNFKNFKLVTGTEISSKTGHILGLGITENITPDLSVEETVERIHDLGGIAVAAHPFAKFWFRTCLEKEALKADAIEILNACTCRRFQNKRAELLASSNKMPGIASTDSHSARTIGIAGIECDGDPLSAVKGGKFATFGDIARKRDFLYLSGKKFGRSIKWKFTGGQKLEE